MPSITVIILTKNEEKNIEKSVASAWQIAERVLVVDCGSNDRTVELAEASGAEVVFHEWEGHARQFNWALDHCNITTEWIFRLDADERISKDLADEIQKTLVDGKNDAVNGFEMRWRIYFMGKWIKHGGTHKPYFVRLFRFGKGKFEERQMDERAIVEGSIARLKGDLIHYDFKGIDPWLTKHIQYSNLELLMYHTQIDSNSKNTQQKKRRSFYYRLPLLFRAKLYFWYRYYFQLGFLDGKRGKIFAFLQAYWFRFVVDAKIYQERLDKGKNA